MRRRRPDILNAHYADKDPYALPLQPLSVWEIGRAQRFVASHAGDINEVKQVLTMLGIDRRVA